VPAAARSLRPENRNASLRDAPPILVGVAKRKTPPTGPPALHSAVGRSINGTPWDRAPSQITGCRPTFPFDEDRYFEPYQGTQILELGGWASTRHQHLEDTFWNDRDFSGSFRRYPSGSRLRALAQAARANRPTLSALGLSLRQQNCASVMLGPHGGEVRAPVTIVNQVGVHEKPALRRAQSAAFRRAGAKLFSRAKVSGRRVALIGFDLLAHGRDRPRTNFTPGRPESGTASCWAVPRDYARQRRAFPQGAAGLSGGIDSALNGGDRGRGDWA